MEIEFTSVNFEEEVLKSEIPVLVDFYADWCGPCRAFAPTLEQVAAAYEGVIKVGKVNIDEEPAIASAYGIMSIPTLIIFVNGARAESVVGAQTLPRLEKIINNCLSSKKKK